MKLLNNVTPINRQHRLNRGLLRWWLCLPQRHGGTVWRELTRKSNATISGGALAVGQRGRPGGWGCWLGDGTDDHLVTPAIDFSAISTLSYSYWLYWDVNSNNYDVAFTSTATAAAQGAIYNSPNSGDYPGEYIILVRTTGAAWNGVTMPRPSAATWHHYTVCMDRNAGAQQVTAVYVDGVSQTLTSRLTNTTSTGGFANDVWRFLGHPTGTSCGAGRVDDFRIYNRILTAGEAKALYNESRFGYPNAIRWLPGMPNWYAEEAAAITLFPQQRRRQNQMATYISDQVLDNTALATAGGAALTVPAGTNYMTVEATGGTMNYELDGVTNVPTTGTTGEGSRLYSTQTVPIDCGFTTFRIIRQADVAGQTVKVHYYGGARS